LSLQEATPRFDDARGTIHLDVSKQHMARCRHPFVLHSMLYDIACYVSAMAQPFGALANMQVCGKEIVLQCSDKDDSQEWFVDIARAATSRYPNAHVAAHGCRRSRHDA
jgi:hypothetical protein